MANLSSWKRILRNWIDNPWDAEGNSDHPECPKCDSTMNFYGHDEKGDFPMGEGYWLCPDCSFSIKESDL